MQMPLGIDDFAANTAFSTHFVFLKLKFYDTKQICYLHEADAIADAEQQIQSNDDYKSVLH